MAPRHEGLSRSAPQDWHPVGQGKKTLMRLEKAPLALQPSAGVATRPVDKDFQPEGRDVVGADKDKAEGF